jgi:hypothetical protein
MLLALVFVLSAWACDASRFCALGPVSGEKFDFNSDGAYMAHYFGCAVHSMQSGGGPFQVYFSTSGRSPRERHRHQPHPDPSHHLIWESWFPVAVGFHQRTSQGATFLKGVFLTSSPSHFLLGPGGAQRGEDRCHQTVGRVLTLWLKRFGGGQA